MLVVADLRLLVGFFNIVVHYDILQTKKSLTTPNITNCVGSSMLIVNGYSYVLASILTSISQ
jgi:hypothetical protein